MTQKSNLFKCQRKKKSIPPNRHGSAPQTRKRVVKPSKVTKDVDTDRELTKFINSYNEAAATFANKEGGQLSIVKPQPESSIMHAHNWKSKDLLDWEENSNYSASSTESKLLFCKKDDFVQLQLHSLFEFAYFLLLYTKIFFFF
ncbi:uncharacterized protein [Coffea arabica]|uniref:Uncharacterized protein isoform X1 n=1 Tax=Coffea arabica TaxID=13443 RepID=A0A6P6T768_COFAR|nr:uncharacterized protein LOC113698554 isoform X2 [Coffea arabica]